MNRNVPYKRQLHKLLKYMSAKFDDIETLYFDKEKKKFEFIKYTDTSLYANGEFNEIINFINGIPVDTLNKLKRFNIHKTPVKFLFHKRNRYMLLDKEGHMIDEYIVSKKILHVCPMWQFENKEDLFTYIQTIKDQHPEYFDFNEAMKVNLK